MTDDEAPALAEEPSPSSSTAEPDIQVAPPPHLSDTSATTRRMMVDVLIGLAPVLAMAFLVFRWHAVVQVGLCVLSCLGAETLFSRMRGRPTSIGDCSAVVTGIILGLSLPWSAPWYVPVIGSVIAIGLGKAVFGGLGYNIFNPAMVGRAFVMLSFAKAMGASAYVAGRSDLQLLTQATPLTVAKKVAADIAAGNAIGADLQLQFNAAQRLWPLFLGEVNGSLGEVSALAVLVGGLYLCLRRSASWQIPAGVVLSAFLLSGLANLANLSPLTAFHHLVSGSLLFGAFFIATDPVTSPLTPKGKFLFGLGIGMLVVLIRVFSGYPEGVMFAVLLMNGAVPLMNQLMIPRPVGGPTRERS